MAPDEHFHQQPDGHSVMEANHCSMTDAEVGNPDEKHRLVMGPPNQHMSPVQSRLHAQLKNKQQQLQVDDNKIS